MKKVYVLFFAVIAGLVLCSCTSIRDSFLKKRMEKDDARMLEIHSQRVFPHNIAEITDIPYMSSGDKGHLLDIYYPDNSEGPFPVIIHIHGGGFISESKETNKLYGYHLAEKGFIVFNINYRLALDGTKVPGQIQDVMGALDWIASNMERYPAHSEKIYIMGASAGAYLATMATLILESQRLREIFNVGKPDMVINALAINCGFLEMESKKFKIWAMRSVILEKRYKKQEYYPHLIFKNIPELKNLPPVFITSNKDDVVNFFTFYFVGLLKENNIEHKFYYIENNERKLRHCFDIFNPAREESVKLHNEMLGYLTQY